MLAIRFLRKVVPTQKAVVPAEPLQVWSTDTIIQNGIDAEEPAVKYIRDHPIHIMHSLTNGF